jgi:glucan biosynthesis protein C
MHQPARPTLMARPSQVDPHRGERLEGLDAWRAALMLGGLLLHGSVGQPPLLLFNLITLVSHSFRMGCFFAISGFLGGLAMRRRSRRVWLVRRLVQIGLPALFGLVVICPLIAAMVQLRPVFALGSAPLRFDWYHLWFLLALLVYAPVALLVDRAEARLRLIERFTVSFCTARRSLLPMLLTLAGMSFVLMLATAVATRVLVPAADRTMIAQCRLITGYLPLYLLGFAMARAPDLRWAARQAWRAPLAVVALTALMYVGWYAVVAPTLMPGERAWLDGLVQMIGAALCPPAAFLLMFRSAARVRRTPPLLHRLCAASLTMYLVHLPVMIAINLALRPTGWSPYLEYGLTVAGGGVLSYLLHVTIVRPVPLLLLVVNGRLDAWRGDRRPASVDEPGHHLAIGTADLHLSA